MLFGPARELRFFAGFVEMIRMRRLLIALLIPFAATVFGRLSFQSETQFPGAVTVEERVRPTDLQQIGFVTVTIPYLGLHGDKKLGQGRCYFTRSLLEKKEPQPVYVAAHYPIDQETATRFCEQGFLTVTPHTDNYPLEFVLGDSPNFMKALIQWIRRQPGVDRKRMIIGGGSGGGYMTLAMGAEFFPVAALVSDLPCVNWAYGCNYLKVNAGPSGCFLPPDQERPLPVVAAIVPGLPPATALFGEDMSSDSWFTLSPVSYTDRITAPAMIVCATGDMLCTFEQFTAKKFYELEYTKFPDGYGRDFQRLTLNEKSRLRFDQSVPEEKLFVSVVSRPEGLHEYSPTDMKNLNQPLRCASGSKPTDLPWSKEKQFSFVILDEGSPLPHLGHTRYAWNITSKSFLQYNINRPIEPDRLNPAKLCRLLERFTGSLSDVARLTNGKKANRLNFEYIERYDVLASLNDYAALSDAHARRLEELYRDGSVKPFGEEIIIEHLKKLQAQLPK